MFAFLRRSTITLDCFTTIPYVYDFAKIEMASKHIPNWWIKTSKFNENNEPTIKNCRGFIDYYTTGFVIPSWFEVELELYKEQEINKFRWRSSNDQFKTIGSHSLEQFSGFCLPNGMNIKLTSPWLFKTNSKINFVWGQPTWNSRDMVEKITVLPAVVNFYYQHETHINFFTIASADKISTLKIHPKTPLVILHPCTEKKIIIKNHLVDEKEYNRINGVKNLVLNNTYEELINSFQNRKKLIDECPYHRKK